MRDREEQLAQAELERQKEEAEPAEKPVLTTTIQNFFPEKRFGFLRVEPDNIFFYITQVTDQDLALRQLLAKREISTAWKCPTSGASITWGLWRPPTSA